MKPDRLPRQARDKTGNLIQAPDLCVYVNLHLQGDGVWHSSGTGVEPMQLMNVPPKRAVFQCGDAPQGSKLWAVSSFQLQMKETGTARFGLRLSGVPATPLAATTARRGTGAHATTTAAARGDEEEEEEEELGGPPVLELRKVGAAVVGTGWDRMFAQTTPPVVPVSACRTTTDNETAVMAAAREEQAAAVAAAAVTAQQLESRIEQLERILLLKSQSDPDGS